MRDNMVMRITFDMDAREVMKELNGIVGKIDKSVNKVVGDVARHYADHIQRKAYSVFSYPTPRLAPSIRAVNIKKGRYPIWEILMAEHGLWVERGRTPGKMPPETEILKIWAEKAGFDSIWWLRKTIARHGTKGKEFIRPGIEIANSDIDRILNKGADEIIKR